MENLYMNLLGINVENNVIMNEIRLRYQIEERNRLINSLIYETGISELYEAFDDDIEHMTLYEIITSYLNRKYDYSNIENYHEFLFEIIGFKIDLIEKFQIDESFFEHITIKVI